MTILRIAKAGSGAWSTPTSSGSSSGDLEGRILEANDAFLRMGGYDREDLVSGRVSWTDLTPPEWRERDAQTDAELKMIGAVQPFEKEYFRKDGGRVPVLIGLAVRAKKETRASHSCSI